MSLRIAVTVAFLTQLPLGAAAHLTTSEPASNLFAFFQPTIQWSDDERRRLDERGIVVKILPAQGHELAAMTAGALNVGPDVFVASIHNIVALKQGPYVPQVGRFSAQPRLEDLSELTLDKVDVDEIRRCQPGRCGLKLEGEEIKRLQHAIASAQPASMAPVDAEFRRIVLERAQRFLQEGDRITKAQFSALLQNSPYLPARMPHLAAYLDKYPAPLPGAESFLYWCKETYAWKPMISVTHITIVRGNADHGAPEVAVAARDVFATRYTSGSFVLTLLFGDPANASKHYLVYVNRTWIDGVRALWRPFVEHRVRSQARKVFTSVRDRIEHNDAAISTRK
jgi:hypothetical protein